MMPNFKSNVHTTISIFFLVCLPFSKILAQDNSDIKEPPTPIYVISPYHEDSLNGASEGSIQSSDPSYTNATKKIDTLQQQVQKSAAESTVHFIWLYSLVALLGIMNIVLLYLVSRVRKELAQMKRFEHKMLLTPESSVIPQPPSAIQEISFQQDPVKIQPLRRTRKPRAIKSRIKRHQKN